MQYPNSNVEQNPMATGDLNLEDLPFERFLRDVDFEVLDKAKGRNGRKNSIDVTTNRFAISVRLIQTESPTKLIIKKRRRAQNRASQAAFRARQRRKAKDLEEQLTQLEQKHKDLNLAYESLRLEHSTVKQELEKLQRINSDQGNKFDRMTSYSWARESPVENSNQLIVDLADIYYG